MTEKRDWVKIIAIVLAILFFVLWLLADSESTSQAQTNEDLSVVCQQVIQNLTDLCEQGKQATLDLANYQWQASFNTLLNCYENNVPKCKYTIPSVNNTRT